MCDLSEWLVEGVDVIETWQRSFATYEPSAVGCVDSQQFAAAFDELTERLAGSYPFFHPDYAGQMLKPPHPVAVAGYLAAMLVNANNHAADGGPATSEMELEVIAQLAGMSGSRTTWVI